MGAAAKDVVKHEPTALPATVTPMDLIQRATDSGMDVASLERLMDLQERYETNEARKAYFAAIAQFQDNCTGIGRRKKGAKANYASLDDIQTVITPHLSRCGLTISFDTDQEGDSIKVTCKVSHVKGHSESVRLTLPIPDMKMGSYKPNESQRMGAAMSYARRYALVNALNLRIMDEDSDAEYEGVKAHETVTPQQAAAIQEYIDEIGASFQKTAFFAWVKVDTVSEIPERQYADVIRMLKSKLTEAKKS